jgi:hypothetical protein
MKAILVFMLLVANVSMANPPKGYNYKKHYKKCARIKLNNRLFNANGCKYHTQKV